MRLNSVSSSEHTKHITQEAYMFLEAKKSYSLKPSAYVFVFIPHSLALDT